MADRRKRLRRLLIVDDHAVVREGIQHLFEHEGLLVRGAPPEEAPSTAEEFRPEIVLLDLAMGGQDAVALAHELATRVPESRVLFLDDRVRPLRLRQVLSNGTAGYWTKATTFQELAEAVRRAASGEHVFCNEAREFVRHTAHGPKFRPPAGRGSLEQLTRREMDVFLLLAQGRSVKQCAAELGVSQHTVDNHKSRLMRKLGVHKSIDLAILARRTGALEW